MKEKKDVWWLEPVMCERVYRAFHRNEEKNLIFFDLETTGLDTQEDRMIQLCAIKYRMQVDGTLKKIGTFQSYFNPIIPMTKKAQEITGMNNLSLSKYPTEGELYREILKFFRDAPYVCGHNVSFDVGFLQALFSRQERREIFYTPIILDTLEMARELHHKREVGNFKLQTLSTHFGVDEDLFFHNAADDVIACRRLLHLFLEEYEEKRASLLQTGSILPRITRCWMYEGMRGMKRLYVQTDYESRLLWVNAYRPHEWGEKQEGSIALFQMPALKHALLQKYDCKNLDELFLHPAFQKANQVQSA